MTSWLIMAGDVVFAEEESYDNSDSESGDDIYGYLGQFALPRVELEKEAHNLMGNGESSST